MNAEALSQRVLSILDQKHIIDLINLSLTYYLLEKINHYLKEFNYYSKVVCKIF
jgi:hypothetical protein